MTATTLIDNIIVDKIPSPDNNTKDESTHMAKKGMEHLALNESLLSNKSKLYKAPLIPVDCSFSLVRERPGQTLSVKDMVRKERKSAAADVTLVFAVRNVGCGGCREHGMQLTELAEQERIGLVGVVKETGVDDPGLLDFYQNYFRFPIYKDNDWNIYNSMGGRKINRSRFSAGLDAFVKRIRRKNIKSDPHGEFWMQGGVLVFDKKGELRHALYEIAGEEFDTEGLRQAIRTIRNEHRHRRSNAPSVTETSDDSSM